MTAWKIYKINTGLYDRNNPSGAYGVYLNLKDGTGLKVIGQSRSASVQKLESSIWIKVAQQEATTLKQAEFSGLTPKLYGVVLVETQELIDHKSAETAPRFYVAIHMQHIDGVMMAHHPKFKFDPKNEDRYNKNIEIRKSLENILEAMGIIHNDLHDGNVMVDKEGRFYVIDFSPGHSIVKRPYQKMYAPREEESMMCDMDLELIKLAQQNL